MSDATGGPAFPALARWNRDGSKETALQQDGMTLRDYFAAKAMQANMAALSGVLMPDWHDHIAELSYLTADAMLKARNQ